jgi:hypothetical protein
MFMSNREHEDRIRSNVRAALQRYMHVLIQKHEDEQDRLLRDLLWAEMRELDYWYCEFVEDEDVSLHSLAERKIV